VSSRDTSALRGSALISRPVEQFHRNAGRLLFSHFRRSSAHPLTVRSRARRRKSTSRPCATVTATPFRRDRCRRARGRRGSSCFGAADPEHQRRKKSTVFRHPQHFLARERRLGRSRRWDTVYLARRYRSGDSVSTVSRNDADTTLGFVNTAGGNIHPGRQPSTTPRRDGTYRLKARAYP